ncbi:MAG TPA: hypothetical protein DCE44_00290 [Verrucomicrobiales bacterium]|nr:hypothetical protein [Verrucomicrobiales bacterium]
MNWLLHRRDVWIGLTAVGLLLLTWFQNRRSIPSGEPTAHSVSFPARPSHLDPSPVETVDLGSRLNTNELAALAKHWRQTGLPDPMGRAPAVVSSIRSNAWAGFEMLKLSGIWIQSARRLAVINQQVVAEGESIAGFRLERCESDGVWIAGSGASRRLALTRPSLLCIPTIGERKPGRPASIPVARKPLTP